MAIVLMVFLTLVFGMLDLGIAVLRYHQLAQAARQGAREASVHGSLADKLGTWGPGSDWGPYSGKVSEAGGHPLVAAIQASLVGFDPSQVYVDAQWLGGNDPRPQYGHRVRVTVSADYQPIVLFIFGSTPFTLEATSTMAISH